MNRLRTFLFLIAVVALAVSAAAAPPVDYILCSCTFCKANPDVDCQVSPSGYSILCSDWSRLHC
jgi:hypothetical protein